MSGHNKWTKIKHKKAAEDQGRGKLFSRLAKEISIAARDGTDPQFNAALRSAIDRAKKQNMPQANIDRVLQRASSADASESLLIEAYGPEGVGLLIEATTDNRNRTINEIRSLLKKRDAKIAEQGSLMWSFEKRGGRYFPKFPPRASTDAKEKVDAIRAELEDHPDTASIYTSIDDAE